MQSLLRRAAARLLVLAVAVSGLCLATVATSGPASAATMVRECKVTGNGCVSFSGYAGRSTWGYPVSSRGTNCVNYVAYRLARNGVARQSAMGNGGSWAASARKRGFRVDRTPKVGSIAQWNYGSAYAPSYGHVGYVEEVTSSYLVISDNSYGGGYSSRWRVPKGDRNWPSNFIHFKDTAYQPPKAGSFLKVRETGRLYRLVGTKTPLRVASTTNLGTIHPYLVASTTLATLPASVPDGTFLQAGIRKDIYRVTGGAPLPVRSWAAVGGTKPYLRVDQQAIDLAGTGGDWNRLRRVARDGQVLMVLSSGRRYVVQAGKALAFTDWSQVGGQRAAAPVDPAALTYAGRPPQYVHLTGVGALP